MLETLNLCCLMLDKLIANRWKMSLLKNHRIALVRLVFRIQSFDLIGEQTKCLKIKQSNINEVLFSLRQLPFVVCFFLLSCCCLLSFLLFKFSFYKLSFVVLSFVELSFFVLSFVELSFFMLLFVELAYLEIWLILTMSLEISWYLLSCHLLSWHISRFHLLSWLALHKNDFANYLALFSFITII